MGFPIILVNIYLLDKESPSSGKRTKNVSPLWWTNTRTCEGPDPIDRMKRFLDLKKNIRLIIHPYFLLYNEHR